MSVHSGFRRSHAQGRISGTLILGVSILLVIVLFSVIGPFFVNPHNAHVGAVRPRRPPSAEFLLGTDSQGRDMLTLLIYGTPNTIKMGLVAGFIGVGLGLFFGLLAGNFGGVVDAMIRVLADALLTLPAIAILVIIAGNIGHMTTNIMALVVASLSWMFHHPHHTRAGADHPRALLHRGGASERGGRVRDPV
jgi:peptide/nickel transport system permease protein